DGEGARLYPCANLMPQEPAIDEAQGGIRLEVDHELMVKVGWVVAAHAQDTAAPGLPRLCPPEYGGMGQGPGGHRQAGRQASLQESTTTYTVGLLRMCLLWFHR